jgi:hypothetical protein
MATFINDIISFSNLGKTNFPVDFLKENTLIENLSEQKELQRKGFRQIPQIYKIFHVIVSEMIDKYALCKDIDRVGLISAYEFANLEANIDFEAEIINYGVSMINPIKAPFTVCNSCTGWLAIKNKMPNLNLTVCSGRTSIISAIKIARDYISSNKIDYCIILSANLNHNCYKIIDEQNTFMKSEFASAILVSNTPEIGKLCELQSTWIKSVNIDEDVNVFLNELTSKNISPNYILFDGEYSCSEFIHRIENKFSNRCQCSFFPIFLQNSRLLIKEYFSINENISVNYIIFDKAGNLGCLKIKF